MTFILLQLPYLRYVCNKYYQYLRRWIVRHTQSLPKVGAYWEPADGSWVVTWDYTGPLSGVRMGRIINKVSGMQQWWLHTGDFCYFERYNRFIDYGDYWTLPIWIRQRANYFGEAGR